MAMQTTSTETPGCQPSNAANPLTRESDGIAETRAGAGPTRRCPPLKARVRLTPRSMLPNAEGSDVATCDGPGASKRVANPRSRSPRRSDWSSSSDEWDVSGQYVSVYLRWAVSGELVAPCSYKVHRLTLLYEFYHHLGAGVYNGVPRKHWQEVRYRVLLAGELLTYVPLLPSWSKPSQI